MFKLFKKSTNQPTVVEPVTVETKPTFAETMKAGSISLGKEIVAQTISSLLIVGAVNGFQYLINKQAEKKAAEKAASSQE